MKFSDLRSGHVFTFLMGLVVLVSYNAASLFAQPLPQKSYGLIGSHRERIMSLEVFSDGKYAVTSALDGDVKIWDLKQRRLVRTFALKKYSSHIWSVSASPSNKLIAVGSSDSTVRLLDVPSGRVVRSLKFGGPVHAVAFSPDGTYIAAGGWEQSSVQKILNSVKIWSTKTGELWGSLPHQRDIRAIAFSPRGTELVVNSGNIARVWDVRTRRIKFSTARQSAILNAVVYSPNGRLLALGARDGNVGIWDTKSRKLLHRFSVDEFIQALAFSSDGKKLVIGSSLFGKLAVVNTQHGFTRKLVISKFRDVNALAFMPKGKSIIFSSGKEVWHLDLPQQRP